MIFCLAVSMIVSFGSWPSPLTSDLVVSGSVGLCEIAIDGQALYWRESRPQEKGRNVLMQTTTDKEGGVTREVLASTDSIHTRVHEYGGAPFAVSQGEVVFSNAADQRLYLLRNEETLPIALTPDLAGQQLRYADGVFAPGKRRLYCVQEDHRSGQHEPENTIVCIDLDGEGGEGAVVVAGRDFYASPRLSPDGSQMAWLAWDHPNMPWDGTELWVGDVGLDGSINDVRKVAGGPAESLFQPQWSPAGVLHYISDRTGWWNLYRIEGEEHRAICPRAAEFAVPMWVFGLSTYAFVDEATIACAYSEQGIVSLALLDIPTGTLSRLEIPYTLISGVKATKEALFFVGGAANLPSSLIRYDLATGEYSVIRASRTTPLDPGYLSIPDPIEFPTEEGKIAYALFYRPTNKDCQAPAGEKPPLIVRCHGGPTSQALAGLDLSIQYWTSRGFAVVDVNYGGSSGYGREYRQRLNGQWGIVDVEDCVNGALFLAKEGLVDEDRLIIRGGSAGGYTTLSALAFCDVFHAGASYYGVSDLEALVRDTHKFEAKDLDKLIGLYPQEQETYRQRSPVAHADEISCPVIFFQGGLDAVVPPNQSEAMRDALEASGIYVEYVFFPEERHGFRNAVAIKTALEREYAFYQRVFGLQ